MDGGIVKTPIIGRAGKKLEEQPSDDAAYRYDRHLRLGYERWKTSRDEWKKSGKKALHFVMCNDTEAADLITRRLNTDTAFAELHDKTINLHTNLKGKLKKQGRGVDAYGLRRGREGDQRRRLEGAAEAVARAGWEPESLRVHRLRAHAPGRVGRAQRDDDRAAASRQLEGEFLPEQTLGRGLRRMTPSDQAAEVVTVVEHPAFAGLYQEELAQEGLPLEIVDVDQIPSTTVSIYPDKERKDLAALEILVPTLSPGHRTLSKIEGLGIEDVRREAARYKKLPRE